MDTRKGLKSASAVIVLVALAVCISVQPAWSAVTQGGASTVPWTISDFDSDNDIAYLSMVYGGPAQIPIISFFKPNTIGLLYMKPGEPGLCGPGDAWTCFNFVENLIEGNTLSAVAEHTLPNSFRLGWVYEAPDDKIYLYQREYTADMELLVDPGKEVAYGLAPGSHVIGQPSLTFDQDGNAHIAVILSLNTNPVSHEIKYIHQTNTPHETCNIVSSQYDCITIKTATSLGLGFQPGIVVDAHGDPRIIFYDGSNEGGYLTYAYPQSTDDYDPNCGPDELGNYTWRCVEISSEVQSESDMDLDIGPNSTQPQMAWTHRDSSNKVWVHHARYVGSGGNCGEGYHLVISPPGVQSEDLWDCNQTEEIGSNPPYQNVSIQVDQQDNPVIAFNKGLGQLYELGVSYGSSAGAYTYKKVDGHAINTGKDAALALDKSGRGFIVYIEDDEISLKLKIAYQSFYTYIPSVQR